MAGAQPAASAMPAAVALDVEGLDVRYRDGAAALQSVTLSVPTGSITALVGMNGAGKSTLFKAIMGFVPPSAGRVTLFGLPVRQALRANLVAYVPQAEEVDWSFPVLVEDVVMMGRYGRMGWLRRPRPVDHEAVEAALVRVGLSDLRHRQIGALSGGQRKRAFLARALAQDGRLILLDEPFAGVDLRTEGEMIALLGEMREEGRAMLVATHDLGTVPEFCDRVALLNRTLIAAGSTQEVFTHDNLAQAFGGQLRRYVLAGDSLHEDDDPRGLTVVTDEERPLITYGRREGA